MLTPASACRKFSENIHSTLRFSHAWMVLGRLTRNKQGCLQIRDLVHIAITGTPPPRFKQ
jgi:hypothetical protein